MVLLMRASSWWPFYQQAERCGARCLYCLTRAVPHQRFSEHETIVLESPHDELSLTTAVILRTTNKTRLGSMVWTLLNVTLGATTLLCSLVAGLVFGFAVVVMPWNRWNRVRTVAAVVSVSALLLLQELL